MIAASLGSSLIVDALVHHGAIVTATDHVSNHLLTNKRSSLLAYLLTY
jgi:hypothetical protein